MFISSFDILFSTIFSCASQCKLCITELSTRKERGTLADLVTNSLQKKNFKGDFEAVKNIGAAMRRNILERNLKNNTWIFRKSYLY